MLVEKKRKKNKRTLKTFFGDEKDLPFKFKT